jgi:hypothetical protein
MHSCAAHTEFDYQSSTGGKDSGTLPNAACIGLGSLTALMQQSGMCNIARVPTFQPNPLEKQF